MGIHRKLFLEENIGRLLFKFSAPAALSMIILAISSIVDTIFIGQFVGTLAIAALTLALPILMSFNAIASTIGIGATAIWSIDMGSHNQARADKVFANAMILNILIGLLIGISGILFLDPILHFFNAPPDVYPYAKDYLSIIFLGSTLIIFTISSNNFIRAEGMAKTAMGTVLVAVSSNIIFDFIFIYYLGLGIKGCAFSSLVAYFAATAYIIFHFTLGKSKIRVKKEDYRPDFAIISEIGQIGTSSFLRQISIGIMQFMLNMSVILYAGSSSGLYLAIIGITLRLIMLILMPVLGILQGMQPIIGFNYGAKAFSRAKQTVLLSIISSVCIASTIWMVIMLFPKVILAIFSSDQILIDTGASIIRIIICILPLVAAQTTGAGLFQVLKKPLPANFFAMLRQVILLTPIIIILPMFLRLQGVWYAVPIADFLAFVITAIWVIREIRSLDNLNQESGEKK